MIVDATGSQEKTILAFLQGGVPSALDVGCGTGAKTALIARHSGGAIVGIDPDADCIRSAQARHGGRNLMFQVARAEALCFDEASFDAVCFNESLHHVPVARQIDALRESHRVLKPRGRMLITEPVGGSGSIGRTLQLYLDEKEQKQCAIRAIDTVASAEFDLQSQSEIRIEYRFNGFEEFYAFYAMTRPDAGANPALKSETRERFDRCRRNPEGDTILDYAATVWQFIKS